jgi:hypothetical protein
MVNPDEWSGPLATARSGEPDAADRMVSLLLQWTHRKLHACTRPDKEDLCASFVEHIIRDQLFMPLRGTTPDENEEQGANPFLERGEH